MALYSEGKGRLAGPSEHQESPLAENSSMVSDPRSLSSFATIGSQESFGVVPVSENSGPVFSRNYEYSRYSGENVASQSNAGAESEKVTFSSGVSNFSFCPVNSMDSCGNTSGAARFNPSSYRGIPRGGADGETTGGVGSDSSKGAEYSRNNGYSSGSGRTVLGSVENSGARPNVGENGTSSWLRNTGSEYSPHAAGYQTTTTDGRRMYENSGIGQLGSSHSGAGSTGNRGTRNETGNSYTSSRLDDANSTPDSSLRRDFRRVELRAVPAAGGVGCNASSDRRATDGTSGSSRSGLLTHLNNRAYDSYRGNVLGAQPDQGRDLVRSNNDLQGESFAYRRDYLGVSYGTASLRMANEDYGLAASPRSLPARKVQHVEVLWDQKLGNGAYGAVYKAKCDRVLLCAAKILHPILQSSINDPKSPASRFNQESEWMSSFRHPNIVQYLRTNKEGDNTILLMELMDQNLTTFLRRAQGPLQFRTEVRICHDVAMALSYLHSNNILHRDLSSNNVLLIGDARAKIADFGMAKVFDHCRGDNTACPGTEVYMPPEVINERNTSHTQKIDSFSFGVLMVQIATRAYPRPGDRTRLASNSNQRMIIPEIERRQNHLDEMRGHPLRDLAVHCLSDEPENRPSSRILCLSLEEFCTQVQHADPRGQTREDRNGMGQERNRHSSHDSSGSDSKGDHDSDKLKRKMAMLEEQVECLRRQVQEAERSRDASLSEVDKLKSKLEAQDSVLQSQSSIESPTLDLPGGLLGGMSLHSPPEDSSATTNLPASHSSTPMEELQPRSFSLSCIDLSSHKSSILKRLCSVKVDVAIKEEVAGSAVSLDGTLKSLSDGSEMQITVEPPPKILISKEFSVRLKYTPQQRGRHQIALNADGKEEYSKEVFVSTPVTQLNKQVRKMFVPSCICYLAVRDDFIYCTVPERGEFFLRNKNDGGEILSVNCKRKIRGIAIGPDNNIFITGDHVVQKYSPDQGWKVVASHGGDQAVEYSRPNGIGFFNEEVFICDTGNSRLVVCSMSLNRVRNINLLYRGKQDPIKFGSPEDVAFDEAGRVFVADSKRKSIVICALDGNFLGEIYGDAMNCELSFVRAVRVYQDKILVIDRSCRFILVFNIATGKRAHKIPINADPMGLCIDQDGFIYISCSTPSPCILVY